MEAQRWTLGWDVTMESYTQYLQRPDPSEQISVHTFKPPAKDRRTRRNVTETSDTKVNTREKKKPFAAWNCGIETWSEPLTKHEVFTPWCVCAVGGEPLRVRTSVSWILFKRDRLLKNGLCDSQAANVSEPWWLKAVRRERDLQDSWHCEEVESSRGVRTSVFQAVKEASLHRLAQRVVVIQR